MMNERLNHLRLEAGISRLSDLMGLVVIGEEGNVIDPLIGLQAFAELIIKECAAYLNGAIEVHDQHDQDLCDLAARKIKEHFGVNDERTT
jgi:hypothetical protein